MPVASAAFLVLSIISVDLRVILFAVGIVFFILTFPLLSFFRDPFRRTGEGIVSPADGKVMFVEREEEGSIWHIAIFMSPLNVHVNRAPLSGKVVGMKRLGGGFRPAFNKDSAGNERVVIEMDTHIGTVRIVQIAGALARRIVPYVDVGSALRKGERIGMIRFGSRVDVYLSVGSCEPVVIQGQKVAAGKDTIAILK